MPGLVFTSEPRAKETFAAFMRDKRVVINMILKFRAYGNRISNLQERVRFKVMQIKDTRE